MNAIDDTIQRYINLLNQMKCCGNCKYRIAYPCATPCLNGRANGTFITKPVARCSFWGIDIDLISE